MLAPTKRSAGGFDESPLDFAAAQRGRNLAPGPCRPAEGQLRARTGQGGLLRPGHPYVSPPSADGLDRLGRAAEAARLRSGEARRQAASPWEAPLVLGNAHVKLRYWHLPKAMDFLVRNADGDELLFVHSGAGDLYCDYGHLAVAPATTSCCRAAPCGGSIATQPIEALLIEATGGSYRLPEKGLVGQHAIFDPAMLDMPRIDDAFRAQQTESEWRVQHQAARQDLDRDLSVQSAGCGGLARRSDAGAPQRRRHPAADEPPLSSAAIGPHDLRRRPFRGLHLRPAPLRERSRRDQGAVLPQQRRFRRGDLLSRRRFLQPRQHPPGHDDLPSLRLHPWAASQGAGRHAGSPRSRRPTNMR